VREQVRDGATDQDMHDRRDHRRLSNPNILEWSTEEFTVLVDEAHRLGRSRSMPTPSRGSDKRLSAGDTIEHGTHLDEATARLMAQRGVFLVRPGSCATGSSPRRSSGHRPDAAEDPGRHGLTPGVPLGDRQRGHCDGTDCSGRTLAARAERSEAE
jgi:hypothetical protein